MNRVESCEGDEEISEMGTMDVVGLLRKSNEEENNRLLTMGNPLGNGMHFTKMGSSKGQTEVTGYTIVQAEDMEGMKAIIADHPHFMMPKASIEVLEIMPMM